jgi:hypothetical protein
MDLINSCLHRFECWTELPFNGSGQARVAVARVCIFESSTFSKPNLFEYCQTTLGAMFSINEWEEPSVVRDEPVEFKNYRWKFKTAFEVQD